MEERAIELDSKVEKVEDVIRGKSDQLDDSEAKYQKLEMKLEMLCLDSLGTQKDFSLAYWPLGKKCIWLEGTNRRLEL